MDFTGPMSDGKYLMVLVDDYSRFPVVYRLPSMNAEETVTALDEIICTFGVPAVIRTDNAKTFTSNLFK